MATNRPPDRINHRGIKAKLKYTDSVGVFRCIISPRSNMLSWVARVQKQLIRISASRSLIKTSCIPLEKPRYDARVNTSVPAGASKQSGQT